MAVPYIAPYYARTVPQTVPPAVEATLEIKLEITYENAKPLLRSNISLNIGADTPMAFENFMALTIPGYFSQSCRNR